MKSLRPILLLLLQCCCYFVYPQTARITFEHIGTNEGLSQSNILSIIQDSRGFMWFGSWDGLNKYDGYKITVYKNNPSDHNSISNNYINKISEDEKGNLWIGTNDGLNCFDRKLETFKRFRFNPNNNNSIRSNYINELLAASNGKIWIGTTQGLDCYDPANNKFTHMNLYGDAAANKQEVTCIYEDSRHNIWISFVETGIAVYNTATGACTFLQHDEHNNNSLSGNHINNIFEDSKQRIWIGTNGCGLDLYDVSTKTFRHFKQNKNNPNSLPKNVVLAINEDADNNLWVSTENGGLSLLNYNTGHFTNYQHDEIDKESISNNSIYCIYKDSKKNMWLGNFAGWIDMAMLDKCAFPHFKRMMSENSLSNNQVLSITEDRNKKIWIGTDGGGLNIFDPATGNFTRLKHQENNPNSICGDNVLNTLQDSKGNTWVGTWIDGITILDRNKNVLRHFKHTSNDAKSLSNNNAWKIFEDRQQRIWIGTYGGGLELLNPDGKTFTHFIHNDADPFSISGNNITNIYEDSEGYLWICAENAGLNRMDKRTGKFTHFTHDENKNSISNNNSNAVFEDESHTFWIATMNGLNCYDKKNNRFTVFTSTQGLPGDYVFGILEDDKKNLWLSTNKGISCFNRFTKSFKNFSVTDGLQSNEFKQLAYCKTAEGMMYFGGINGFNMFNPEKIKKVSFDPPLVITNFTVFNKQIPIETNNSNPSPLKQSITETKSITLPYSSSVLSFEFASLNYTSSEKKQYAYILEGFDKEWNQAGSNRTATYTNLDPGKYTFKVRGLNNQGAGSANITSIELVIEPPFWLTWWFKVLVLVTVTGSIAAFYIVRVAEVEQQKIKLEQQVSEKTQQLQRSTEEERKARQEAEIAHISTILANKELEASEQRYSSMFHSSPQPMYVFDIDTLKFFQVNKAATEHYGYTEEEFMTMNIMDIRPREDRLKVLESIEDFKAHHDRIFSGRFRHIKKSGEMMEVEIYSSLIIINGKEYMLIIAIDITDKLLFDNKLTKAIIKTQEDERYEIGGELHDNICQILATSQLNISMLKNSLPASARPFYEQGRMHIKQALDEIRNLSHRLAPAFFDEMTLEEAFRLLIETFNVGDQYNISLYFYKSVNEVAISRDIQLNLYRILQEQLRNIVKYAHAKDISVDLMINQHNELVMQTSDDGIGFNTATNKCGIGFANMKRRAELFSGTISIDSSPGNGCNITVTIPLAEKQVVTHKKRTGLKSSHF